MWILKSYIIGMFDIKLEEYGEENGRIKQTQMF